jgi:hypothetical protein
MKWILVAAILALSVLLAPIAKADNCFRTPVYYGLVPTGITEQKCYHSDGGYQLCRYGGFLGPDGRCWDFPAQPGPGSNPVEMPTLPNN